jgi:hypothetical protein
MLSLQDTQEQLDTLVKEHQLVQQQQGQLARDAPVEQQPDGSRSLPADTLARIAGLEAAQQELKEQQQRLEAAQQQFAAGDSSCTSLDSQPSSVKER